MNKRKAGAAYEDKAAEFLVSIGMKIVTRNYRTRYGEIDIIAMDGKTLVFVEVKERSSKKEGAALEAVNRRKQLQVIRMAKHFLMRENIKENIPMRFDCVGYTAGKRTYIRDAFE